MGTNPIVLTPQEVAERIRAMFDVWNTLDPDKIVGLYTGGYGFGYRTRASRPPHDSKEEYRKGLMHWLGSLISYEIGIDDLHTLAEGNLGIGWGYYYEKLHVHGREPEVMRGRFSEVVRLDPDGWKLVFYHRDMTPFDDRGFYLPQTPPES